MTAELPFLGRAPHLETLTAALDEAAEGRRILAAIQGGAGSGKTRLLDEFEARAALRDVELRRAQAFPASATQPGAVAGDLDLADLEPVRPAVIVLDDAHWADATSISDLRSLLLQPRDRGLLIVLTHRPVDVRDAPTLQRLLEVSERRGDLRRLELGPLTSAALVGVIGGDEPGIVAERLLAVAGGSPLALEERVDQLVRSGALRREGDQLIPVGPIADWPEFRTFHQRVAELPRDAKLLVRSAALASHPIPLPVAANLLGDETDDVLDLAEDLVDQGFLSESPAGFLAPSTTEAEEVVNELGVVRRGRIHGALADAMTDAGLDEHQPGIVGTHQLRAGRFDEAVTSLAEAGLEAVGRSAFAEALPMVSDALEALEQVRSPDAELEGRLLFARARCYRMIGRSDLAADDADGAALRLTGEEQMRALGWRAQIADDLQQATQGEWLTAFAELEAARLEDHASHGAQLTLRAKMLGRLGMPAEADDCLRRGVRLLRIHGDDDDRFIGHWNGAWLAFDRGQVTEADAGFEYCTHQARHFAGEEWLTQAEAWRSRSLFWKGHVTEAIDTYDRTIDAADRTDNRIPVFLAALGRAEGMALIGRNGDALLAADDALDVVVREGLVWENAVRYARAVALFGAGDAEAARSEAEQALAACPPGADGERWRKTCRGLLIELRAACGDEWDGPGAVALSRELLAARWFAPAIRLLMARAVHEERPEIARQAAALALELGIPALAARAIDAGDLWDDAGSIAVAAAVGEMGPRLPEAWREEWRARPEIAPAFELAPIGPAERLEATQVLAADLEVLLGWVGLVSSDLRIGPREWTAPLPRPPEVRERRRRFAGIAAGTAVLIAVVAAVGLVLATPGEGPSIATDEDDTPRIIQAGEMIVGTWTLGGGPERTGVSRRDASALSSIDGAYWIECTGQPIQSSPAISGQFVYVGSDDEHLHRFNATTGRDRWTRRTDGEVRSSPHATTGVGEGGLAGRDSMVFVGSEDGTVRAWTRDGDERWSFPTGGAVESSPIVIDGTVYVGSRAGRLFALTADLGELVWQWPAGDTEAVGPIRSSPAVSGDLVYVGSDDGHLYAVERSSGDLRWEHATGAPVQAAPVVHEDVVYAPSHDTNIHSLDAETGRPVGLVQYRTDTALRASPAIADGYMYVPNNQFLIALDLETGQVDWSLQTSREITAPPVVAGDYVYVASTDGTLYAVHRHEGGTSREPVWTFETGGAISASPALADGAVVVASWDGCVYALGQDVDAGSDGVPDEPQDGGDDEPPDDTQDDTEDGAPDQPTGDFPSEPVEERPDDMPDVDPGEVDLG